MNKVIHNIDSSYRGCLGHRGFTLIEMVIVIVILGIASTMVSMFILPTIQGYIATARRAEMTDAADTTLRRIARDVHGALPFSLRPTSPASTSCFEFIPIVGGGRYRAALTTTGTGDILDFTTADSSFDTLASTIPAGAGNKVVIANMGSQQLWSVDFDAYSGNNAAAIASFTATSVTLSAAKLFPNSSDGNHFFVIPTTSVAYSCTGGANGQLIRTTQAISSSRMAACPSSGTVIVDHVDCTGSSFNFTSTTMVNQKLLGMTLVLLDPDSQERVRLYHEVFVNNAP